MGPCPLNIEVRWATKSLFCNLAFLKASRAKKNQKIKRALPFYIKGLTFKETIYSTPTLIMRIYLQNENKKE